MVASPHNFLSADNTQADRDLTRLEGFLPPEMKQLTEVVQFIVSGMALAGPIVDRFSTWSKLKRLVLIGNNFDGSLPGSMNTENPALTSLQVGQNNFEGAIPTTLGLLNLTDLDLANNAFTGPLPSTLGNLTSLCMFRISSWR
jgi:hypothetical protein